MDKRDAKKHLQYSHCISPFIKFDHRVKKIGLVENTVWLFTLVIDLYYFWNGAYAIPL